MQNAVDKVDEFTRHLFKRDNYVDCGKEGPNFVFQRNIFGSFPIVQSGNCKLYSISSPNAYHLSEPLHKSDTSQASKSHGSQDKIEKEKKARYEHLKSFYLLHKFQHLSLYKDIAT